MDITAILKAALALGGVGVLFGVILSFASKKFAVPEDARFERVREALPGANCGACGYAGCDAFAQAIIAGKAELSGCLPGGARTAGALAEIMGGEVAESKPMVAKVICQGETGVSHVRYEYDGYHSCRMASSMGGGPKQCPYACVGLGDCVQVCAFDALTIENGLAVVDEEKCTACGMCAAECPRQSIQMRLRDAVVLVRCQNNDTGRMAREACGKACIACKRCAKECKADAITVHGYASIDPQKCTRCGDCVGVCPMGSITMGEAGATVRS